MTRTRVVIALGATALALSIAAIAERSVGAQAKTMGNKAEPVNEAPNPYQTIENYFKLPEGRKWGSTSAIDVDKDGKTIWVAERCGTNSCLTTPDIDPVLHFDEKGNLIKSFGKGLLIFPHGIWVDRDGNVWVTDGNSNAPTPARGGGAAADGGGAGRGRQGGAAGGAGAAAAGAAAGGAGAAAGGAAAGGANADAAGRGRGTPPPFVPPAGATKGHQVIKFSPDGRVLLTIGKPGGAAPPECCYQPNDVITNANGDIFISEGHGNGSGLIFKFDKTGKFIKTFGQTGTGVGQLNIPHSLALDSRGRLFVANRGNTALTIYDQEGNLLEEWYQFSRISGIYIDKNDRLYAVDSESSPTSHPGGWKRGLRIGSARDGKVEAFIPDPQHTDPANSAPGGTSAAEGVVADAAGNLYGAEVGPQKVQKYVKK